MTLEQIFLIPITILCAWSLLDSIAITKLTQVLFIIREGDKLACSIYCSIISEILNIEGLKEKIDESDSNQKIGKYTDQINSIIISNMKIEKGLYEELKRRKVTIDAERQLEKIRNQDKEDK